MKRVPLSEIEGESDVEQKFVLPLLTAEVPEGLGIPISCIQTKHNIRKFIIGKGSDQKSYFPDYLIVKGGFPIAVIEAKTPGADLLQAFREARLYAQELNAIFPSHIDPVTRVIATDAKQIMAGPSNQAEPVIIATFEELEPHSVKLAELQAFLNSGIIDKEFSRLSQLIKPKRLWSPKRLVGGPSVQREEIGQNTFGATISADLGRIFNPIAWEDRATVVRNAYIKSKQRNRYVDPIDKIIRASAPSSEVSAKLIDDVSNSGEFISTFRNGRNLEHQVLLIVGGVGSGKTTFIDYLQEVALPTDVREKTVWVHINMNLAPISPDEIYGWLRKEIVEGIKSKHSDIDFDDINTLKALYAVDVNKFRKGRGSLYAHNEDLFNEKLGELLEKLEADPHHTALSYCRYCGGDRGKLIVLVLDNCDKRSRDEQLLMFEAAQWMQREFKALVVLPLREETYDNHRDEPPLDTALKDLVFRIEPPPFQDVLVSRVQLALDQISASAPKVYRYELPNSMHVDYAASDQGHYLSSIVSSIFQHDRQIRRLILGLSGRNIRRAFEIFLEFCTSGHIAESEIVKIKTSEGKYTLPLHVVLRVLLRSNRRFYDSDRSYLKNLFSIDAKDSKPSYFTSLLILNWLYKRFSLPGPTRLKGYFRVETLLQDLSVYGVDPEVALREIEVLAKSHCIVTEDFRVEGITTEALIRLAPAGFVHLDLLSNVNYWAAIAEDTWFDDEAVAQDIARRIGHPETHYSQQVAIFNARDVLRYIEKARLSQAEASRAILENSSFDELVDLAHASEEILKYSKLIGWEPWLDADKKYQKGQVFDVLVSRVQPYGFFVDFEPGVSGLVHKSKIPPSIFGGPALRPGTSVKVEVLEVNPVEKKISLNFVGTVNSRCGEE